jgi:hypothetical protein
MKMCKRYILTPDEIQQMNEIDRWQPQPDDIDYQEWLDQLNERGQEEADRQAMETREKNYD